MATAYFNLDNTKTGDTKWTADWSNGKRKVLPVKVLNAGTLADGKTIHINARIRNGQNIVIYHSGADSRFWGRCFHTKEDAIKLGW